MITLSRCIYILGRSKTYRLKHTASKKVVPKSNKKYTNTVLLPKTDFKVIRRSNQDEHIIRTCGFAELYKWQRENVKGPEFVLHDGPPYANGPLHMGHAINKILKDVTLRHKLMQGHRVHYRPGWDCHGLPIELKATSSPDARTSAPLNIRSQARKFAQQAIRDQAAGFRSWGIMADWDGGCYYTFDKSYVKNQLQQFYKLYKKGLIYQDVKPVYWSPSSRTALAEAELEYKEHVSPAVTVRLRITDAPPQWGQVYALTWTTTPWTLPANQALAFSPSLPYSLVSLPGSEDRYLVASTGVARLSETMGQELTCVLGHVDANELSALHYEHPVDGRTLPLLPAEHVTADKGTGLVHTAPSHGPDDFKLGAKFGLPVPCLVDEEGRFTAEAGGVLEGLSVLGTGGQRVVQQWRDAGAVVHHASHTHPYPHDWRTGLPVILRASKQWFFDTSAVKEQAIEALKNVRIIPERWAAGLASQVQSRPFWCISRQRVWGVPVPALYTADGRPVISQDLVDHYCTLLDEEGDDFWWTTPLGRLAPSTLLRPLGVDPDQLERGQDIMDIWLDSGLSWSAALDGGAADLYLEGVDQFNGWFQSSLLTSVALQQTAPYKTVFVHGFAVDEKGMKMSKSVGNVVNPQDIVRGGEDRKKQPALGLDTLRWWVAAHANHRTSVPVSAASLTDSAECVGRLRRVLRFMLGAVHGLPSHIPPPALRVMDRSMLHSLTLLEAQVVDQYNNFHYSGVCNSLNNFVANQLSAFYCHLVKDRLYCEAEDSSSRRAVQLTLYHCVTMLARLMAPILPLLAEEVYSHLPYRGTEWLGQVVGPSGRLEWQDPLAEAITELALEVKQTVLQKSPINCTSQELWISISAPADQWDHLKELQREETSSDSELCEVLQAATVTLTPGGSALEVQVRVSQGAHCERCRRYTAPTNQELCQRCSAVMANG